MAPGAAVALRLPDPLDYATAMLGIIGAGRVVVPLDPAAPGSEVSRMLAVARPPAMVCGPDSDLPIGDLPAELTLLWPAEAVDEDPVSWPESGAASWPEPGAGIGGIFLCTSGTTGTPKGILLRDSTSSRTSPPPWPATTG